METKSKDNASADPPPLQPGVAGVLIVEAVNLGATVFDTNDISTIRGSSLSLLRMVDLMHDALSKVPVPDGQKLLVVTKGASSLELAISGKPDDCTDGYLRELEAAAVQLARSTAPLSTKHEAPWANKIDFSRFCVLTSAASGKNAPDGPATAVQLLSLARADLLRKQMQSLSFPMPLAEDLPSWKEVAEETDPGSGFFWPATIKDAHKSVSHSVARRRAFGRVARQEVIPLFLAGENAKELTAKLAEYEFSNELSDLLPTHEEVADYHLPEGARGKLALIHLDGNKFGKRRAAIGDPHNKAEFSEKLRQIQAHILTAVIEAAIGGDPVPGMVLDKLIRLECLMIGGDEMLLVIPAFAALQLFARMQQAMAGQSVNADWFGNHPDAAGFASLTHATAMVIAPAKLPIRQLRDISEGLLTLTKSRENGQTGLPLGMLVMEGFAAPHQGTETILRQRFGITQDLANAVTFAGGDGGFAPWPEQLSQLHQIAAAVHPSQLHRLIGLEASQVLDQTALEQELSAIGVPKAADIAAKIEALGGRVEGKWIALHHLRQLRDFL